MNIIEATRKALETNSCITQPEWAGKVKIKPTDTIGHCIVMYWDGSHPSKHGWNPGASDILREDYLVVME